jgi:pimeloyl-ACP methyl ester carboxylesterase
MKQTPIPYTDFGGTGVSLHFLHANGYPPACYTPLIEHLKPRFHTFGMHLRPLWPDSKPEELRDWRPLADDFLRFLADREADPVFVAGHSVGGIIALRAALKEPRRFRGLALIDPVLFPPYFILFWNLVRAAGLGWKKHPKISGALNRRRHFDDLDTVFRGYRRRSVFRNLSDESLRAYIEGMTRPGAGGGYELVYSPEWEALIYYTGIWHDLDLWRGLQHLKVPTLFIRGAQSDTFWAKTAVRVQRANPQVQIETLENTTHILPLEEPEKVGRLIVEFANFRSK